jgi:hypothetical protein
MLSVQRFDCTEMEVGIVIPQSDFTMPTPATSTVTGLPGPRQDTAIISSSQDKDSLAYQVNALHFGQGRLFILLP